MSLKKFTNLYSLSKTLRFELIPQGKTLEHIQAKGLLDQDMQRAKEYMDVKKIIDEYHKHFIEESLNGFSFSKDTLKGYAELATIKEKDDKQKKELDAVQAKLRKEVVKRFNTKRLFGKELIQEDLPAFLTDTDKKALVENFNRWTTYFTGFNENRKNMYSDEEKSTAISYRIVNENLPKFIANISDFEKIKSKLQDKFDTIQKELGLSENIGDYFVLDNYSKFITQRGIDSFNLVIGGKTLEDKTKIKGLNEYINLYNQVQKDKKDKLPKLTPLFKMILSDRSALSWLPEQFEKDCDVLDAVNQYYLSISEETKEDGSVLLRLKKLLQDIKSDTYDLNKVYLRNDTSLTNISQKYLGHYGEIQKAVEARYEKEKPKGKKQTQEKYDDEKEKYFKRFDSFSLEFINDCTGKNIEDYFAALDEEKDDGGKIIKANRLETILEKYNAVKNLLNVEYPSNKKLSQDKDNVAKIKELLDSIMDLYHFVKPLYGKGNETDKDGKFYGEFSGLFEKMREVTKLYDKVRNYMTKKPYSVEKIKLNFENSTLCNGWDKNKEQDNTAILLRKEDKYYLAIMNFSEKTKFDEIESAKGDEAVYEKMDYKLLPGPNKMLPKVFFSEKGKAEFYPDMEILQIYENACHKKGDTFDKKKMHKLIDFFKASIAKHKDWSVFGFDFSDTSTYESIDKFYREISEQGYKISYRNIPEERINQLVEDGKLYLFQIYNKDFSEYSKGTPNMHTLYWKELFSDENLKNVVYKLNGEAEVFYRVKSVVNDMVVHEKNKDIDNKNKDNPKKTSRFAYDIIKDKRYTVDKFQFHCPITLNFKAKGNEYINEEVNSFIKQNGIKHIIGIDRGERHLLYVSVIDLDGNIKEQFSLNEIINEYNGNKYKTDYHKLLDDKEIDRTKQRQEWKTIENIKELKAGYLSQVIHKISELIVKYEAIVVLEDLNLGFVRGRQKIEKSIYQQFEKKLIDKLNYLVFKKNAKKDACGVLNALQLTNKFESFQKLGKQSGFLFYVQAWNTSKIDPVTGFVSLFDCRYENVESAKKFFGKFDAIRYNNDKDYFEFGVKDYTQFNGKAEGTRQEWIICTNDKRIKTFRNSDKNNQWDNTEIILTDEFKKLFEEYKIDINSDIKKGIIAQTEKSFFETLLYLFKLTVQMRNSITGTDVDYMISPVADENGQFFDSRKAIVKLPNNADANGAYNIARKGLMVIDKIKNADDLRKVDLKITNKEWLQFAQKH